jgi:hypothetical protein
MLPDNPRLLWPTSRETVTMFLYRAFGLTISSELACPELPPGFGMPDVEIRIAQAGTASAPAAALATGFDAAPGFFRLRVPNIARFVVADGRSITIEPHDNADEDSIRLFLLGTAVGALLHQRAVLPLHGSAVCKDGRSLLILGASGVGKSTLAAALGRHGWRMQTDDISALNLVDGRVWCEPGFPRQKMWPDSLSMLGDDAERHARVRPSLEKRSVVVTPAAFHETATPVSAVLVLRSHRDREPHLSAIDGPRRMAVLKRQTFRARLSKPLQAHVEHFRMIAALASQASLLHLKRPLSGGSPLALANFVAPHLENAG